jgi:hypothetical protein
LILDEFSPKWGIDGGIYHIYFCTRNNIKKTIEIKLIKGSKKMKRLFTLLLGSSLFVSGAFAQIVVKSNIVNTGNMKSKETIYVRASLSSSDVPTFGQIRNGGLVDPTTARLDTKAVEYQSVSYLPTSTSKWNIGADGLLSNQGTVNITGSAANTKLVKEFKQYGRYYISFPFDVTISAITHTGLTREEDYAVYEGNAFYTVEDQGNTGFCIRYYNSKTRADNGYVTSNNEWLGVETRSGDAGTLKAGELYAIWVDAPSTFTFPAVSTTNLYNYTASEHRLGAGHREVSGLTYYSSAHASNAGWNAIGHLHTTNFHITGAYDTDPNVSVANGVTSSEGHGDNGDGLIYVLENGVWKAKVVFSTETHTPNVSVSPYAGLMIQIADDTDVTFLQSGRKLATGAGAHFRSSAANELPEGVSTFDLQLYKTGKIENADVLTVQTHPNKTNSYDIATDALKFFGTSSSLTPEFYTIIPNYGSAQINVLNAWSEQLEVPVGLRIKEAGNYTIDLADIRGLDGTTVYLIDKSTGKSQAITDGAYSFDAAAGTIENRFALRGTTPGTTDLPASVFNKTTVYAADNNVYVKNLTVGDQVSVYNVAGQLVETLRATSPDTSIALPAKGVYVVKVSGAESVVTKIINK